MAPIVHIYVTPDFRNDHRALFPDTTTVLSQAGYGPLFAIKSCLFFFPAGLMLLSHMPESAKERPKPDPACRAKHWRVIVKPSLTGEC